MTQKSVSLFGVCALTLLVLAPLVRAEEPDEANMQRKGKLFRGRVVYLLDALKERGVRAYDEHKQQVVLETASGELIPILSNWRGRAFYQDERLRNRKVELIGYRNPGVPYIHVMSIFVFNKEGERQYMDYWCDICSIPMYEIKPCDCCQDDIRIRFQTRELPDFIRAPKPDAAPADSSK